MTESSSLSVQSFLTFQKNLVAFFDELIEMFPREGDFVIYRIMVKDQIPITELVKHISEYLLPQKDKVENAIKSALETGNAVPFDQTIGQLFNQFGGFDKAAHYKRMFDEMDNDSKIAIWKWLKLFIHLLKKCEKC